MRSAENFSSEHVEKVVRNFEYWRSLWSMSTGAQEWNNPEILGNTIWFRRGFPYPDWTAFGIEAHAGAAVVLRATTERRNTPLVSAVALFSDLENAGKYINATVADFLRMKKQLDPVYWEWKRLGVDTRLEVAAPTASDIEAMNSVHGLEAKITSVYLKRYVVQNRPTDYACLTDGKAAMSHVLLMDVEAINEIFARGITTD